MTRQGVPAFILDLLTLGDAILLQIPPLVPHGQGNHWPVVKASPDALYRVYAAQQLYGDEGWGRIMRMSAATMKLGSGACHEYAALVFLAAREALSSDVVICYVSSVHLEHAFVTLGVPGAQPDDQVVVLDAWPERPQALLWKDHFCHGFEFKVRTVKFGCKGTKTKLDRARLKHFSNLDGETELARVKRELTESGKQPDSKLYVQVYGSTCGEHIDYYAGTS